MAQEIPSIDGSDNIGPIKTPDNTPRSTPDKSQFGSYMEQPTGTTQANAPQGASGISPIDLPGANQLHNVSPNIDSLLGQVYGSDAYINELQKNLRTPNLRFKRSEQYLLRNKLSEANTHLTNASEKMGAKSLAQPAPQNNANPVERFISLVTHGQNQLYEAKETLLHMKEGDEPIDPAKMMLIQVKLAQAQQELEYASILLSKVVDVIKQMMNIQL